MTTVVEVRVYSRICGNTSLPVQTNTPGRAERTISAARCSWLGLRTDQTKEIATALTSCSRKYSIAALIAASSSGLYSLPSLMMRPPIGRRRWRGTSM
ncbi:hypothetical protein D3C76_1567040 [compost metagenome]